MLLAPDATGTSDGAAGWSWGQNTAVGALGERDQADGNKDGL